MRRDEAVRKAEQMDFETVETTALADRLTKSLADAEITQAQGDGR